MTKLIPFSRAAATAAAVLGPCLAILACPAAALAGASAPANPEDQRIHLSPSTSSSHASSGGASIVRTIVGLAIVIAVIWGLSWILRQVKTGRDPHVGSAGLESIAALPLGTGRSVHLVRAGSEYVLLGSAEHGLVPIHRYTEEEARDAGLLVAEEPAGRRVLGPLLKPKPTEARSESTAPAPPRANGHGRHDPMRMPSPSSGLVERLRELTVRR